MRKIILTGLLASIAFSASAQDAPSPIGRWKTFDAGKPKGIVEIYQARDGTLAGKVLAVLDLKEGHDPACTHCRGALHNRPIVGMVTLQGLKPAGSGHWHGGSVLDPENGRTYKAKLELLDGGRRLGMSGCVGFLCRQQVWTRE